MDQNFKSNTDNYKHQTEFLKGLLDLLERLMFYVESKIPEKDQIYKIIQYFQMTITEYQTVVDNLKTFIVPVS